MKKIILFTILLAFFSAFSHSQNTLEIKKATTNSNASFQNHSQEHSSGIFSYRSADSYASSLFSLLKQLPEITVGKNKIFAFTTSITFSEILEGTFENINSRLITDNDYADIELYDDAPFSLKIKCLIRL